MKSAKLGQPTSVEVSNVSTSGFWLLIGDKERFLPFADFPWFRDARIRELVNVELQSPNHLPIRRIKGPGEESGRAETVSRRFMSTFRNGTAESRRGIAPQDG